MAPRLFKHVDFLFEIKTIIGSLEALEVDSETTVLRGRVKLYATQAKPEACIP